MFGVNSYYDAFRDIEIEREKMEVGDDRNNECYYKECLRNHAASLGSYATDGCGEFTPSDTGGGTLSLQCAACGCHRSFHRKVTVNSVDMSCSGSQRQSPVAEELPQEWEIKSPKKRVRTKFTTEQKEKMLELAEKLEWKMHRGKEEAHEIERFCRSIGVSKKVFKVWMHNHKNNSTYSSSI